VEIGPTPIERSANEQHRSGESNAISKSLNKKKLRILLLQILEPAIYFYCMGMETERLEMKLHTL